MKGIEFVYKKGYQYFEIIDLMKIIGKNYIEKLIWLIYCPAPYGTKSQNNQIRSFDSYNKVKWVSGEKIHELVTDVRWNSVILCGFKQKSPNEKPDLSKYSAAKFRNKNAILEFEPVDGNYTYVRAKEDWIIDKLLEHIPKEIITERYPK